MRINVLPVLFALAVPQVPVHEAEVAAQIGVLDGPARLVFARVVDLAFDPDDNVFVLDADAGEVRVFRPSGEHVRTFGRTGQGPGEFDRPVSVSWNQGELLVQNAGGLASRFEPSGRFIESSRYPFGSHASDRLRSGLVVLRRSGSASLRRTDPTETLLLVRSESVDSIASAPSSDLFVRNGVGAGAFRSPFCGLLHHAVTPDGLLAVAEGLTGQVRILELGPAGSPRPIVERGVTSAATALSQEDYGILLDRVPARFSATRQHLETAPVRSWLCGLEAGPDGRLWVRMPDREEREVWVARDRHLEPQFELVMPAGVSVRAIGTAHVFGLWRDELGVQYVMVLRMPRDR